METRNSKARAEDMKAEVWGVEKELSPGITLRLRRVKNYTKFEEGKESYAKDNFKTELVCLKKVLPIAPCQNPANSDWLLDKWIKTLQPILEKYQSEGYVSAPTIINDPISFIQAIVLKFRENQQQKER